MLNGAGISAFIGQCDPQDGFNFNDPAIREGKMFLYNLKDDVHETTDLSDTGENPQQGIPLLFPPFRSALFF